MNKEYEQPTLCICKFTAEEIMTASGTGNQNLYSEKEYQDYHISKYNFDEIPWQ